MADKCTGHWDGVYREKDEARLSWHQDEPTISLELCDLAGVDTRSSVIDIGAGMSRFAARLVERGFHDVTVLDVSAQALERSRRDLGHIGERIAWIDAQPR